MMDFDDFLDFSKQVVVNDQNMQPTLSNESKQEQITLPTQQDTAQQNNEWGTGGDEWEQTNNEEWGAWKDSPQKEKSKSQEEEKSADLQKLTNLTEIPVQSSKPLLQIQTNLSQQNLPVYNISIRSPYSLQMQKQTFNESIPIQPQHDLIQQNNTSADTSSTPDSDLIQIEPLPQKSQRSTIKVIVPENPIIDIPQVNLSKNEQKVQEKISKKSLRTISTTSTIVMQEPYDLKFLQTPTSFQQPIVQESIQNQSYQVLQQPQVTDKQESLIIQQELNDVKQKYEQLSREVETFNFFKPQNPLTTQVQLLSVNFNTYIENNNLYQLQYQNKIYLEKLQEYEKQSDDSSVDQLHYYQTQCTLLQKEILEKDESAIRLIEQNNIQLRKKNDQISKLLKQLDQQQRQIIGARK
ncbi:hypothetical protein SS50377_27358 [Spironucleus salmonicida]|uniref:Uncharacterized protein n=1 Tax=Spironucleus salmonicida TaxID=348837 RepID=V6LFM1_9EUKA|nr:hypothetical protein SS50377_27358 [Spironucleus salmonicida]|eukprot:EST43340.1 Hypothetical protein SS50377_17018 [Spironucleus salmonicida]